MQDLNVTMFYKAKFQISIQQEGDLLWKLVLNIRSWITYKLNRGGARVILEDLPAWTGFKQGSRLYDLEQKNRVYCESAYFEGVEGDLSTVSWACKIIENLPPKDNCAPRQWTTEIGYQALSRSRAEISYVISYSDRPGFIGPVEDFPGLTIPKIIRWLIQDQEISCTIGSSPLSITPFELAPGDYPAFQKLLMDPKRSLPILFVSPRRTEDSSEEGELLVDVEALATNVAASALVYYTRSLDFLREMHYLEDSRYLCSGGALRVYFPEIRKEDPGDSYRHRFLSADFISEKGSEQVIGILRRALAQDVHYYDTLFRLEDCRRLKEDAAQQEKLQRLRAMNEAELDEATTEYLREADRREAAETMVQSLEDQVAQLRSDNECMALHMEAQKEQSQKSAQKNSAIEQVRKIEEFPDEAEKIARYFEAVFPDRIVFTAQAFRSMKDCTTKPALLWDAFYHMATELYDLLHQQPATAYREFTDRTGWECSRGEGKQTRKDSAMMRQYWDSFEGREINIEPHVKAGRKESDPRFVRIHFAYDPSITDRIIVGHCGKHLDNFSTRNVR